jgi:hypothetical protein
MALTSKNYFSPRANRLYFSASQVKQFKKCEAQAMAEIRGKYIRPASTALMVGSYVDAALTGDLDKWLDDHPETRKKDGSLKAEFVQAHEMVQRAWSDHVFKEYLKGRHQAIMTGKIFGVPFKCKFDALRDDRIVDLKTVRDMQPVYMPGHGRVDFATAWDWPLQMAIYQKIVEINKGVKLPCFLAVITKETPADIAVIQIEQERMDAEIAWLEQALPRFEAVKSGLIPPERCGQCAYCRETHKISGPVMLGEYEEMGAASNE